MNRRHLFNLMAGLALAPEALIELPKRTHFLPPRGGWRFAYQTRVREDLEDLVYNIDPFETRIAPMTRFRTIQGSPGLLTAVDVYESNWGRYRAP